MTMGAVMTISTDETNATAPDAWVKAALVSDLDIPRPVIPVTLYGQSLVLFRDDEGELGLIGRNCPHRGADLCFGRREDNGLRCPFHGWHFDRTGQCVEQPAEPEDSTMYKTIKLPSFPVMIKDGVIFTYMGAGEPGEDTAFADPTLS